MRKLREKASTGIYHVMLRGINKQDVFLDKADYRAMQKCLSEVQVSRGADGKILERDICDIFAYNILPNHLHILIRERKCDISSIMKRLEDMYVMSYNLKYDRVGHLFQGRFKSEPVEDEGYFHTLLRYIHRNHVKAGLSATVAGYEFCSWGEYRAAGDPMGSDPMGPKICNVDSVLRRYPIEDLVAWVEMDVDDNCMDIDSVQSRLGDGAAWKILSRIAGCENPYEYKQLSTEEQFMYLKQASKEGVSFRQGARFTSFSYTKIKRLMKRDRLLLTP